MRRIDVSAAAQGRSNAQSSTSADEWKHPLQAVTAYAEAIGRWLRQDPVDYGEIEAALDGIDGAVLQSRRILTERSSQRD